MKSVVQAMWLLTVGIGNLINIPFAEIRAFPMAYEFFMFAILMALDMFLFWYLATWYIRSKPQTSNGSLELKKNNKHKD